MCNSLFVSPAQVAFTPLPTAMTYSAREDTPVCVIDKNLILCLLRVRHGSKRFICFTSKGFEN